MRGSTKMPVLSENVVGPPQALLSHPNSVRMPLGVWLHRRDLSLDEMRHVTSPRVKVTGGLPLFTRAVQEQARVATDLGVAVVCAQGTQRSALFCCVAFVTRSSACPVSRLSVWGLPFCDLSASLPHSLSLPPALHPHICFSQLRTEGNHQK